MKEWIAYLGEIILITAVSGLLYHVAPEGNMKKHLQFVISLCILTALAVPMFSMVTELPEIFEKSYEEVQNDEEAVSGSLTESLISASKKEIESAITSYISDVYGIPAESVLVETVLNAEDPENIEITEIHIVLRGDYGSFVRTIREDLHEMFLGKSEIMVSVEGR